jgi:hypothetical protein
MVVGELMVGLELPEYLEVPEVTGFMVQVVEEEEVVGYLQPPHLEEKEVME